MLGDNVNIIILSDRLGAARALRLSTPWLVLALALVLAMPAPQVAELVEPVEASDPELLAARYLLQMSGSHPCLTVLAGYAPETPVPM